MLVLSRRNNEKVLFPGIDAFVQVLGIKPGVVRLGITAPPDVTVLRGELDSRSPAGEAAANARDSSASTPLRELRHALRNRLNSARIGLALLRKQADAGLAEAMTGTIDIVEREIETMRRQVEATAGKSVPAKASPRRTALLVEDDANERELLAGYLRLSGVDVAAVGDGCDALEYLHANGRPDVVLLDMVLPRCDGPTTVRKIRREPTFAGLKIYGVTGRSHQEFDLEIGPGGIDRWFQKPLDPAVLVRGLTQELGQTLQCA